MITRTGIDTKQWAMISLSLVLAIGSQFIPLADQTDAISTISDQTAQFSVADVVATQPSPKSDKS